MEYKHRDISVVTYYPTSNPSLTKDEVNVKRVSGEHRMLLRNMLSETTYNLIVSGRDIAGNEATSEVLTITTATDTRPPLISELKVEGSTLRTATEGTAQAQLVVTWNTDEGASSQVEYGEGTGSSYTKKHKKIIT